MTVRVLRRHARALRRADPELVTPVVMLPLSVRSRHALRRRRRRPTTTPTHPEVDTEVRLVPGERYVPVRLHHPRRRSASSPALVWMHAGGYVLGAPEQDDDWCSRVAHELGALVVGVGYRLAPEHPYPAALDDCFAVLEALHRHADVLGLDPGRISVGGDSAGGGLAAALAQRAHDDGVPVASQLLAYPMLDDRTAARRARWTLGWNRTSNRFAWSAYLGRRPGGREGRRYAVPARREDLAGLPATWIGVGDVDLFHDESVDYATRLRSAGVPTDLHVEPGMYHGADTLVPDHPAMQRFRERMLDALWESWTQGAARR